MGERDRIESPSLPEENWLKEYEGQNLEKTLTSIILAKQITKYEAAETLFQQINKGNYTLVDTKPPKNFIQFFTSSYNLKFWLTSLYLILTLSSVYLIPSTYPLIYIRYACTLSLTLLAPGYALVSAFSQKSSELLEKMALGVVFTMIVTSTFGYIINFTSLKIEEKTTIIGLIAIIFILSVLGSINAYRERSILIEKN